jgi:hypothetical protein
MKAYILTAEVTLPFQDIEVQVEYTYDPGEPDQMYDSYGDPGTPGYGPSIDIHHIWAELPNDEGSSSTVDIYNIAMVGEELELRIIEKYHE